MGLHIFVYSGISYDSSCLILPTSEASYLGQKHLLDLSCIASCMSCVIVICLQIVTDWTSPAVRIWTFMRNCHNNNQFYRSFYTKCHNYTIISHNRRLRLAWTILFLFDEGNHLDNHLSVFCILMTIVCSGVMESVTYCASLEDRCHC